MNYNERFLDDYLACKDKIVNSNFENFLGYKKLFKLVFDASNNLSNEEFKAFCNDININHHQAREYYRVYDKLFSSDKKDYRISDELAKRAMAWDKSIWIEFSKIYSDDKTRRKTLFYTLVSKKLKYGNITIPVESLKLNDVKKFRQYVNKYKPNKYKNISSTFKSLRTRLNNFINKEFKNYTKSDKALMEKIKLHQETLIALIEEHLEQDQHLDTQLHEDLFDDSHYSAKISSFDQDNNELINHDHDYKHAIEKLEQDYDFTFCSSFTDNNNKDSDWNHKVNKFTSTDIFELYSNGSKARVNWENPYYTVIFLGLDIFNLPSKDEYRKMYKELVLLFHPDNKSDEQKPIANILLIILNDINLNVWGIGGERYFKFIQSIKFSLLNLGVN